METQPSRINGKADTVSDETLMMATVSLNHARNQTVRLRLRAPASESYGGSSRPHLENPWAGLSWENYSSPTSGLAANQVPKPAGLMAHFLDHENVYLKHSLCLSQNPVPQDAQSLTCSQLSTYFSTHFFLLFSPETDATGMETDLPIGEYSSYTYLYLSLH